MTSDDRMTWGLIIDILDVLERHGYHRRDNQHTGQAAGVIWDLARVYEGTRDTQYGTHAGQAPPRPGPALPVPQADRDAVVLTGTEVSAVVAALDLAADYKRDRAETCADCADQSCPTCQSRLQEAQAYDQIAAQMLRTTQPEKATQPEPPRRTEAASSPPDREATGP